MTNFERRQGPPFLSYEAWKVQLRKDCETEDKLVAFDSLGEYMLELLWGKRLAPTARAIVRSMGKTTLLQAFTDTAPKLDGRKKPVAAIKMSERRTTKT